MKRRRIPDTLIARVARIIVATSLPFFVCIQVTAQRNALPPSEVEKEFRERLAKSFFPAPPDSVLTCPWDSIFKHVDRYTYITKLSDDAARQYRSKYSWLSMFEDPPPRFGFMYHDCRVRELVIPSPSYKGGLCINDSILSVNGVSVQGKDSIFDSLRSAIPDDSTMHLEVLRGSFRVMLHMQRNVIKENCVAARRDSKTIFVRISSFDYGSADEFDEKVGGRIGYNNIDSMIIDLRDNPGGSVSELVDMLERFCPKGTVTFKEVSLHDSDQVVAKLFAHPLMRIPTIVILVDSNSASASEAFTGCLKLHRNAKVLGTRTFGKGIVQRRGLIGDYLASMTIAEYFAGGEMKIHKVGVEPDGPVPAWLKRQESGMSPKTARLDMEEVRARFPYPHELALKELGLDWSQAQYIWGINAEVYFARPSSVAKK